MAFREEFEPTTLDDYRRERVFRPDVNALDRLRRVNEPSSAR